MLVAKMTSRSVETVRAVVGCRIGRNGLSKHGESRTFMDIQEEHKASPSCKTELIKTTFSSKACDNG